ncbi:MAG TPA: DUF1553 domain-containing protein [Phycisphaerae bacterium]|nr:DUF1553 domain-containing protein [Phycisphaerae bacterium]
MKTKAIALVVFMLASSGSPLAGAEAKANVEAETSAETKAKADYDAATQAAKAAEAAVAPLKDAMQKADTASANASKTANTKRQQATDAKGLAGDPGVEALKQAEANLPAAIQALTDATNAKPPLDKALADAKAAALPLQQAYDAAEKAAKEAEAAAKAASDAANKLDTEAKGATTQAAAKRRAADAAKAALARAKNQLSAATTACQAAEQAALAAEANAKVVSEAQKQQAATEAGAKRKAADATKAALTQAQQNEQQAQAQATAAAQRLASAPAQKKAADDALADAKKQMAVAVAASQAAEQAAESAAARAKQVAADAGKTDVEKKQAADEAAAWRAAADAAKPALAQTQQGEQQAQAQATAAAQKLTEVQAQKKSADGTLANAKNQAAAATTASQAAEQAAQAAQAAAKAVEERNQAAAQAAAKRQAADAAKAALAQTQQGEQQAQAQATAAAQKLTAAQGQKKPADDALANAKNRVATATAANQAAQEAAKELIPLDAASKQAAAEAAAKRKVANEAKAALAPKAKTLEQAAVQANTAAQTLARAETRKKSAEEGLANLKKRMAAAKETHVADEQAAKEAEAAAAPLKEEAEKTRAAYADAMKVAAEKRTLTEQVKAALYRLVAGRQVAKVMESSDPPKPANRIDEIVFAKLKSLGIEPALCSDAVFIRRAYLDLTGKLPTADEAKAFIQDSDQKKRVALIDRLLDQSAHVDYCAMKWSDVLRVKAEFPVKLWPNAAQAYHRWVWESIAQNKRYDQFARELLASSGSNFRVGPVNFYRAIQDKTPEGIAAAVALTLMGTRVHLWPEDRRAGMTAFFTQVGYKPTSEWKEEIIFWDPLKSTAVPGSIAPGIDAVAKSVTVTNQIPQALATPLSGNGPLAAVFPDGTKTTIPPNRDPREVFADWLIRPENPWFAKAIANRTWAWVMGRGIIHEPDDIREDNPPGNPELLAYLEKELVSSGYDLKHLNRLIFTSTTYQFSSIPRFKGPEARAHFASYLLRRVEAEVLIDALNEITGSSDLYTSAVPEPFTYIPAAMSAVALADGSVTSSFLALFGRSARATGMEGERGIEVAGRVRYDRAVTQAQVCKQTAVEYQADGCAQDIRGVWRQVAERLGRAGDT